VAIEQTLVPIRERSFLDILDLALVVLRRRPWALAVAAVAGCAPFAVLNEWLARTPDFPPFGFMYLVPMEIPWATAPLTIVLGGLMFGTRPGAGKVASTLLKSAGPMLVFQVLLRGLLILFFLLSPLIPTRLAFLDEVILLERGKWWEAYSRCGVLCGERGGELFMRALAQICFMSVFVLAFWWATELLSALLVGGWSWDDWEWPSFAGWRVQAGLWLAVTHLAIVRFLSYLDLRIRLEGWEVELRLRQAGAMLENSQQW
jgi:hypothetical protein